MTNAATSDRRMILEAERHDRGRVLELVRRVGRTRMRFTIYDVRRAAKRDSDLALERPGHLHRHLAALEGGAIQRVGKRLPVSPDQPCRDRRNNCYVLTERMAEYERAAVYLDDVERAYVALWVAVGATGEAVPTNTVTQVLGAVEPLALERPALTNALLTQLRTHGLVTMTREPGERWVRWSTAGPQPEIPQLGEWTAQFQARLRASLGASSHPFAIESDMARELITIALRTVRSAVWPDGHPVTLADVRAAAGLDSRAAELWRRLAASRRGLAGVLGDVTRPSSLKGPLRDRQVVIVAGGAVGTTYYDVRGVSGFESRQLWLAWRLLRERTDAPALDALRTEHRAAERLLTGSRNVIVCAIAASRMLAVQQDLDCTGDVFAALTDRADQLSKQVRAALAERRARFDAFREAHGTTATAAHEAETQLGPLGLSPCEVLSVPRPLATPGEYAGWHTPREVGSLTGPQLLARATRLERYGNPAFEARTHPDPDRAARTCVDRADALLYAAEKVHGRVAPFLALGHRLLGTSFRDPRLPRLLLADPAYRRVGLSALVLLGDTHTEDAALALLRDSSSGADDLIAALHALLILRRVDPAEWPERVRAPSCHRLLRTRNDVILSARHERWLGQR